MATVKFAFERGARRLPVEAILPVRTIPESVRKGTRYRRIEASLREIGLIEPIVVYPQKPTRGESPRFLLLDGHVRHEILRSFGETHILCLVATDDEGFTYNHKINQASPIQEHFMILKAIENGVSEERIANALGLDLATIHKKRDLLEGICGEAVELLKKHPATPGALRELRRVLPMRQIEIAELMIASRNFSVGYAKGLVQRTPPEQLLHPEPTKGIPGLRPEDVSRMQREMQTLETDFRRLEESHGKNMLNLVPAVGYVRRILDNAAVVKHLSRRYKDLLAELERIVEDTDLGATRADGAPAHPDGAPPAAPSP